MILTSKQIQSNWEKLKQLIKEDIEKKDDDIVTEKTDSVTEKSDKATS